MYQQDFLDQSPFLIYYIINLPIDSSTTSPSLSRVASKKLEEDFCIVRLLDPGVRVVLLLVQQQTCSNLTLKNNIVRRSNFEKVIVNRDVKS